MQLSTLQAAQKELLEARRRHQKARKAVGEARAALKKAEGEADVWKDREADAAAKVASLKGRGE